MEELNIIFEDDSILVLEKPVGVVVNRAETTEGETLQDQLSGYFNLGDRLGIGDRAGIVHRLDRETSGLMVVAKTKAAFENLQAQFKNREIVKEYIALVHGEIKEEGVIDRPIVRIGKFGKFGIANRDNLGVREAKTEYSVSAKYQINPDVFLRFSEVENKNRINYLKNHARDYTLLLLRPKTGRTHQLRVHLKSIGHPIVSDLIYAPAKLLKFDLNWCPRLFLHAKYLEFKHPASVKRFSFESGLPNDLKDAMLNLE